MRKKYLPICSLFIFLLVFDTELFSPLEKKLEYADNLFHSMRLEWAKGWDLTEVENFIDKAKNEIKNKRFTEAERYLDTAISKMKAIEKRYNQSYKGPSPKTSSWFTGKDLVKLVAYRTIERGIIGFSWGQSVAMKGLIASGNWMSVKNIIEMYMVNSSMPKNVNDCAIGDVLISLYEITKDERYIKRARELGDFVLSYKDRLQSGGIVNVPETKQLWIDTVYMICPFMVRLGGIYKEEGIRQLKIHIRYLMDPNIFLFHHAWDELTLSQSPNYWARGNGWMLATLVEVIPYLEGEDKTYIETIVKNMIMTLIRLQDSSGLWHTLINMKDTYLETSGSALISYGIAKAVSLGILNKDYLEIAQKTFEGIRTRITREGDVLGVSEGTGPGDYIYYTTRKTGTFPHGQGSVLLLGGALNEKL